MITSFSAKNRRRMLLEMDINKHNFSKIGKYISNKLHHIRKRDNKKHVTIGSDLSYRLSPKEKMKSCDDKKPKTVRKKQQWYEPCVGTYRVNYSAIDKNMHLYNFNRSTPHFYRQNYKALQSTPHTKEYPDGLMNKTKGHTELKRMVGRQQIKGSIRRNEEDPHEARFKVYHFPNLALDSKGVSFSKMSERKNLLDSQTSNGAEYDYDYGVNMKRLDSHIISFQKQTSRPQALFIERASPESCRYQSEELKQCITKNVQWSKQLSREVEGMLPSYMEKTVTSRMAVSHMNLKTLQMNCSDLKEKKKIPRKYKPEKDRGVMYSEINRYD